MCQTERQAALAPAADEEEQTQTPRENERLKHGRLAWRRKSERTHTRDPTRGRTTTSECSRKGKDAAACLFYRVASCEIYATFVRQNCGAEGSRLDGLVLTPARVSRASPSYGQICLLTHART